MKGPTHGLRGWVTSTNKAKLILSAVGSVVPVRIGPKVTGRGDVEALIELPATKLSSAFRLKVALHAPVTVTVPERGYWPLAGVVDWLRTAVIWMLITGSLVTKRDPA